MFFRTGRRVRETGKSHVSHLFLDSAWEGSAVVTRERSEVVECYLRNDHLDFTRPYLDPISGDPKNHRPDLIVGLANGLNVALEVKGLMRDSDPAKIALGKKWAKAVNNYYGERRLVVMFVLVRFSYRKSRKTLTVHRQLVQIHCFEQSGIWP